MIGSTVTLDPAFVVGSVQRRMFGSFVEHMGRCVYGGIYEPGCEEADVEGLRTDVLKLTRELGVNIVRYPGGNFVSSYNWEDGVGPLGDRPVRIDLAWRSLERNRFGLNEFMSWARQAEAEPMLAVNLGTRGVVEACSLLEYTNVGQGTAYSDLRIRHGVRDPHNVRVWCLGNEMDGPWQIGHKTATEYGRLAAETAKAMRRVDPGIELVACGSSNGRMSTFASWEAEVLEQTYEYVDFVSLHAYFEQVGSDRVGFLGAGYAMDLLIDEVLSACDYVAARKRLRRKLSLSFDEWNIWYESRFIGQESLELGEGSRLIEDEYTVEDAVVVGSLLMSLLRHADRVGIACLAQLVNVIAPIRAENDCAAWRQTIFYPFALTAKYARGEVLRTEPKSPLLMSPTLGAVPAVDVVATRDEETGEVAVFAVNRHETECALLEVDVRALGRQAVVDHLVMGGTDLKARNLRELPERVAPRKGTGCHFGDEHLSLSLPPVSWTVLRMCAPMN